MLRKVNVKNEIDVVNLRFLVSLKNKIKTLEKKLNECCDSQIEVLKYLSKLDKEKLNAPHKK